MLDLGIEIGDLRFQPQQFFCPSGNSRPIAVERGDDVRNAVVIGSHGPYVNTARPWEIGGWQSPRTLKTPDPSLRRPTGNSPIGGRRYCAREPTSDSCDLDASGPMLDATSARR